MNRKMLIISAGLLIAALLLVSFAAVVAEPASTTAGADAKQIKKILGIVKDTQKRIMSIEDRVYPAGYEYYTARMGHKLGSEHNISVSASVMNLGYLPADVHWELYMKEGSGNWTLHHSEDLMVPPGSYRGCAPTVVGTHIYQFYYRFSTPSEYIAPEAWLADADTMEIMDHYLPGDFLRVEIYDE